MTDVLLSQTVNDGDISIIDGLVEMTDDFRTGVYLALFGGNEIDDGRDNNPLSWWGNLNETNPINKYVSETEFLLKSLPVYSINLFRLEDAALRDLEVFKKINAATEITVNIRITGVNTLHYTINFDGGETVEFIQNWKASFNL